MDAQQWHDFCVASPPPAPDVLTAQQWKKLSDNQFEAHVKRLESWLGYVYIETLEASEISDRITCYVKRNAAKPPGAKDVIVLTGPHAIGKSTLIMRWARARYNEWTQNADHDSRGRPVIRGPGYEKDFYPVAITGLPAGAKILDVDGQTLEFHGLSGEGLTRDVSSRAAKAMRRHMVFVMIVDDGGLLKTNWKGGRDVLDHVKRINTQLGEIGATLIWVGANLDDGDLVSDPQIAGRLKLKRLSPYAVDDDEEKAAWQRVVRTLEGLVLPYLPAGKPRMLYCDLAGELWYRTQGYLGDLSDLVSQATIAATLDGTHKILRKHLDSAELSDRAEKARTLLK
ncbi:hypothetical protein ABQF34_16125 [Mycolicibacterium boenickei]